MEQTPAMLHFKVSIHGRLVHIHYNRLILRPNKFFILLKKKVFLISATIKNTLRNVNIACRKALTILTMINGSKNKHFCGVAFISHYYTRGIWWAHINFHIGQILIVWSSTCVPQLPALARLSVLVKCNFSTWHIFNFISGVVAPSLYMFQQCMLKLKVVFITAIIAYTHAVAYLAWHQVHCNSGCWKSLQWKRE